MSDLTERVVDRGDGVVKLGDTTTARLRNIIDASAKLKTDILFAKRGKFMIDRQFPCCPD